MPAGIHPVCALPPLLTPPRAQDKTPASADVWAVIRKLQDKAKQYQLRLQYYFKDFDKHNDGSVTQPQLIKILSVAYDKVFGRGRAPPSPPPPPQPPPTHPHTNRCPVH